jgi:hypothetical protein
LMGIWQEIFWKMIAFPGGSTLRSLLIHCRTMRRIPWTHVCGLHVFLLPSNLILLVFTFPHETLSPVASTQLPRSLRQDPIDLVGRRRYLDSARESPAPILAPWLLTANSAAGQRAMDLRACPLVASGHRHHCSLATEPRCRFSSHPHAVPLILLPTDPRHRSSPPPTQPPRRRPHPAYLGEHVRAPPPPPSTPSMPPSPNTLKTHVHLCTLHPRPHLEFHPASPHLSPSDEVMAASSAGR